MTHAAGWLRRLASRMFAPDTMDRLIDPILADLQVEYTTAIARGARWPLFIRLGTAAGALSGYWLLLAAGEDSFDGVRPAGIGIWTANLAFLAISVLLLFAMRSNRQAATSQPSAG